MKAALTGVHGTDLVDNKLSGYYVADEISGTYRGMLIITEEKEWMVFRKASLPHVIELLKQLALNVKISSFLKSPRGPKKPVTKLDKNPKHPHVSIAKILAARKK